MKEKYRLFLRRRASGQSWVEHLCLLFALLIGRHVVSGLEKFLSFVAPAPQKEVSGDLTTWNVLALAPDSYAEDYETHAPIDALKESGFDVTLEFVAPAELRGLVRRRRRGPDTERQAKQILFLLTPAVLGGLIKSLFFHASFRLRTTGPVIMVIHDLLSPMHCARAIMHGKQTYLLCLGDSEAQVRAVLPVHRFKAPCPFFTPSEAVLRAAGVSSDDSGFSEREFDLFLPANTYPGRAEISERIQHDSRIEVLNLKIHNRYLETSFDYLRTLGRCRVVFNTSVANPELNRGWFRLKGDLSRRVTARVNDALACGALLLTQRSPALGAWGQEDLHFYAYDDAEEAIEKLLFIFDPLNSELVQGVAERGARLARESLDHPDWVVWLQAQLSRHENLRRDRTKSK